MNARTLLIAGVAAVFSVGAASAETIGIGSTKSSMVAAMTTAISNMVSTKTALKMRREEMGGTQKYIPVVNAGELEFGVSNIVQYTMAKEGRDLSPQPYNNLRLVATMMRFWTGMLVRGDSSIHKMTDLRGKRVAYGFKGAPLFQVFHTAFLKASGLTWDDVVKVPAVGLSQHWNLFKQGKIDTANAGVGGGPNRDMNATIPSGVRYIDLDDKGPGAAAAIASLKGGRFEVVQPRKAYVAIKKPTVVFGYDFMLFTNKMVSDETVYNVTKAMYKSVKDLHAVSPVWRTFNGPRMPKDQNGLEYHAGAVKFYKEMGIWKR